MLEPTPTLDSSLPRRYADFDTLLDALDYAAQGKRGLNFYSPRGELETSLTFAQVRERSYEIGKRLVHFGIKKNSTVALIAETNEDFVC
jgi:fatty-acyl-CoA synthase